MIVILGSLNLPQQQIFLSYQIVVVRIKNSNNNASLGIFYNLINSYHICQLIGLQSNDQFR